MSTGSQRAKSKLRRKTITARRPDVPRVADVAAAFQREDARTLIGTPRTFVEMANDLDNLASSVEAIAPMLFALASAVAQPRYCGRCGQRMTGDEAAAAGLRAAAGQLRNQAAALRTQAAEARGFALEVERATEPIGQPGATLWFARR